MTASSPEDTTLLSSSTAGAQILFATDEWFAAADNLLNPAPPTFVPDLYCEQGKVMDGWETRRKRSAGHDWCVLKLGSNGVRDGGECNAYVIHSVDVDTAYFTGNQAPRISIEGMRVVRPLDSHSQQLENEDYLYAWMPGAISRLARGGGTQGTGQSQSAIQEAMEACRRVALQTTQGKSAEWIEILPMTPLRPGYEESRYHSFALREQMRQLGGVTHIKLNYFPDGGVARLRVWGQTFVSSPSLASSQTTTIVHSEHNKHAPRIHCHSSSGPPPSSEAYPQPELSSTIHGGAGLACSNKHYGIPMNLLSPTLGKDMGDGWETARHPDRPPIVTKDPVTGLQDTPLLDWAVIKLGLGGAKESKGITRIIVDTRHFKGNFPESVKIDGCASSLSDELVCHSAGKAESLDVEWFPLLNRVALVADAEHEFLRKDGFIENGTRAVTHLRVSIYPDGGLSRVRVYGEPSGVESVPRSHL
eukprot:CCRYP_008551-RA/>CCRYP_008551-RA protein AED:0.38 eAED:0.38 QI:0/0.5/0.33/1/0.5/0.66/3/383/474